MNGVELINMRSHDSKDYTREDYYNIKNIEVMNE